MLPVLIRSLSSILNLRSSILLSPLDVPSIFRHIDLPPAKHHPFLLKQSLLLFPPAAGKRDHSACIDDALPGDVRPGRKTVECISGNARLTGESADARDSPVRGDLAARDPANGAPDPDIGTPYCIAAHANSLRGSDGKIDALRSTCKVLGPTGSIRYGGSETIPPHRMLETIRPFENVSSVSSMGEENFLSRHAAAYDPEYAFPCPGHALEKPSSVDAIVVPDVVENCLLPHDPPRDWYLEPLTVPMSRKTRDGVVLFPGEAPVEPEGIKSYK